MTLTLKLPLGETLYTGKQVTFQTPCESEGLTGLIVDGVTYDLVSAMGTTLVGNSFDAGAMVSVIFNLETKKAYVQNADTNSYLEGKFSDITPVYVQPNEPENAPDGSVWFDTDENEGKIPEIYATEVWVFELADGSIVTRTMVMV